MIAFQPFRSAVVLSIMYRFGYLVSKSDYIITAVRGASMCYCVACRVPYEIGVVPF